MLREVLLAQIARRSSDLTAGGRVRRKSFKDQSQAADGSTSSWFLNFDILVNLNEEEEESETCPNCLTRQDRQNYRDNWLNSYSLLSAVQQVLRPSRCLVVFFISNH